MFEAYEESGIQYPLDRKKKSGRLSQEERKVIKENLCQFARKQYYSNGRLNSNEIEKRFHIDIRTYFKDRKEFYSQAGVSFNNLEYKKRFGCTSSERERVKKEIICFVRKKIQNKEKVTRSEICKTFSIDWSLVPYFNSLKEIMVKANDC